MQKQSVTMQSSDLPNLMKNELVARWNSVMGSESANVMKALQDTDLFPKEEYGLYPSDGLTIKNKPEFSIDYNPRFVERLLSKAEFADTKSDPIKDEDACEVKGDYEFEITPVQRFISSFMHPRTPYNGCLLYHGVGVGKTCAAIQAAEAYLDVYPNEKVIIVAQPNIQDGFRRTIFDAKSPGLKINDGIIPNESKQCTGDTYLRLSGTLFETNQKTIERLVDRTIKSRYDLYG